MSRAKGDIAEALATEFLKENGFTIVEQNFYTRFGEIDIIAFRDAVWHFVEVKSGKGEPIYNITPSKLSKILKSVEIYLQKKRVSGDYCIDAVVVKDGECELLENISF